MQEKGGFLMKKERARLRISKKSSTFAAGFRIENGELS
jgi:hypothetical protein